jgi:formate dehydrogenase subunit gamma
VLVHDAAGLLATALVIVHIYMATAATPGSFGAMVRGTVTEEWARRHHPAWKAEPAGDSGGERPARED